jgi:hypothetical protein
MAITYERTHAHEGGTIVAHVGLLEDGSYDVALICTNPAGNSLGVQLSGDDSPESLPDAQRLADEHVDLMGHTCSASCGPWCPSLPAGEGRAH